MCFENCFLRSVVRFKRLLAFVYCLVFLIGFVIILECLVHFKWAKITFLWYNLKLENSRKTVSSVIFTFLSSVTLSSYLWSTIIFRDNWVCSKNNG